MAKDDDIVTIWWIDDELGGESAPREDERAALVKQAGTSLNLVPIHPAEFGGGLAQLLKKPLPDLLLFDFVLGDRKLSQDSPMPFFAGNGVALRGATLGIDEIRDVPAYLVSRVIGEAESGGSDDHFDWLVSHQRLVQKLGGNFLLDDARDYRELREKLMIASESISPKDVQQELVAATCDLLQVPKPSLESMRELADHAISILLSSEPKVDSDGERLVPSRPRGIARWVRAALQRLRGPLIDELAVATMLGVNLKCFEETIRPSLNLDLATYSGIFHRTASMTLWRQPLLQALSDIPDIDLASPTALAQSAAKHFGVSNSGYALCRVCEKRWPEAIAFDEDDADVEAPVHWRCSREATNVDSVFGFEIPRSFAA